MIQNVLNYLIILQITFIKRQPLMQQVINAQKRSFHQKIQKINHSNQILDNLSKKMYNYFNHHQVRQIIQRPQQQRHQSYLLSSNIADEEQQVKYQKKGLNANSHKFFEKNDVIKAGTIRSKPKDSSLQSGSSKFQSNKKQNDKLTYKQLKDGTFRLFIPNKNNNKLNQKNEQRQFIKSYQNSKFQERQNQYSNDLTKHINHTNESSLNIIQQILQKKLQMKEQRLFDLQKQIKIQIQEKSHLYKINVQLEKEYQIKKQNKSDQQQKNIKDLQKQLENYYNMMAKTIQQNKSFKKRQQKLKLRLQKVSKQKQIYKQKEINYNKSKLQENKNKVSRKSLFNGKSKVSLNISDQEVYSMVVKQLDKLKMKVQQVQKYKGLEKK